MIDCVLDKFLGCEIPVQFIPPGIDSVFVSKISGTTGKCLADKAILQAISLLKVDLLKQLKLKESKLSIPACFECTAMVHDGVHTLQGRYVYANHFTLASPEVREITFYVSTIDKDGVENTKEVVGKTNDLIDIKGVYQKIEIGWESDGLEVYSLNCCASQCGCECGSDTGIYIDAIVRCDIEEIMCNAEIEQALRYKFGSIVLLEAVMSNRVNNESQTDEKNIWLMDKYDENYKDAVSVIVASLQNNYCFICNDWNYLG